MAFFIDDKAYSYANDARTSMHHFKDMQLFHQLEEDGHFVELPWNKVTVLFNLARLLEQLNNTKTASILYRLILFKWTHASFIVLAKVEERNPLWKWIIVGKYRIQEGEWCTKEVRGRYGVGIWKTIRNGREAFKDKTRLQVGSGNRAAWVVDVWDEGSWGPRFIRQFNDWELDKFGPFTPLWQVGERSLSRTVHCGTLSPCATCARLKRKWEIIHFCIVRKQFPDYIDAYLRLAAIAKARNNIQLSIELVVIGPVGDALKVNDKGPNSLCMLGDLELKNDDWVKAKETFRSASDATDGKDSYATLSLASHMYVLALVRVTGITLRAIRSEKRAPKLEATHLEKAKETLHKSMFYPFLFQSSKMRFKGMPAKVSSVEARSKEEK
ncbi:Protein CTR9-like [Vitis vinifera]|uniref:Protein CTR9-like n=1 Tax=Vitis vinifera TaxID=29760 RepID=A0A438J8Y8_VITVI|nr:Protein CTR9-like [Vitis vinifera]